MSDFETFETFESSFLGKRKFEEPSLSFEIDQNSFDDWNLFSQPLCEEEGIFFSSKAVADSDFVGSAFETVDTSKPAKLWDLTVNEIVNVAVNENNNNNNDSNHQSRFEEEHVILSPVSFSEVPQQEQQVELSSSTVVRLQLCSKLEKVWYSGRPFPAFSVELVDDVTGVRVNSEGWKVMVSVFDGQGNAAGDKVCELIQNHLYDVNNGCATIMGLRFLTVSSKAGGHYTVAVHLVYSNSPEITQNSIPFVSEKIQVLSYRLFLVPKVENEALTPQDAISKMKGIGNLTSKRFAELGIKSIFQLAALDPEFLGDQGCSQLLNHLRKNRGSLTQPKLFEYIAMAREIVDRCTVVSVDPYSPTGDHSSPASTTSSSCFESYETPSPPAKRHCPTQGNEYPLFPIGAL